MERYSEPFEDIDMYQDHPNVIARPLRIVLSFLVTGVVLDQFMLAPFRCALVHYIGGAGLLICGVALMAAALWRFRAAGTSVETWRSSDTIIIDGAYALTRNPIYIALMLIYTGIGVMVNAPVVVALLPVLFAVLHYGVVLCEEDYLECKFGDSYLEYMQAVRRWF
jgi:protein-S-isoprenylcysteine O-methyltransferase Ste14